LILTKVNDRSLLLHLADTESIPQWWRRLLGFQSWVEPMLISFGCGVALQSAVFRQLVGCMMVKSFNPKQLLTLHLVNTQWFGVLADIPM
jgi:hypothetical protein